jgi:hypothetical protein
MKNTLFITCVLIVNLTFSQRDTDSFLKKTFQTNIEESHYEANTFNVFSQEKLEKIYPMKSIKPLNNSEGKFALYSTNDKILFDIERSYTNESIITQVSTKTTSRSNDAFVDSVILKIIQDRNMDIADFNKIDDFNGDKNINFYKNYPSDNNKLIGTFQLKGKTQLQIGNDINSYMHKISKSEIDKTLLNSLNLLVINF